MRTKALLIFGLLLACNSATVPSGSSSASSSGGDSTGTGNQGASGAHIPSTSTGTTASTATSTTAATATGTDDTGPGATSMEPGGGELFDVANIPDMPPRTVDCEEEGCLRDELCNSCDGVCEPFPSECAETPTCECLLDLFPDDQCMVTPEGTVVYFPFCDGPK